MTLYVFSYYERKNVLEFQVHAIFVLWILIIVQLSNVRTKKCIVYLREKFSPRPGFEPESPALRPGTLTNSATQTLHWAKLEFFSYKIPIILHNSSSAIYPRWRRTPMLALF